jgi:excinuclease ABC subunit C
MKKEFGEKVKKLSKKPGVYFFYSGKEIIYIGKATYLKSRVLSYFSKDILEKRGPLIEKMVSEITDVKVQETESALEALILEANLIKKNQPKYNTKEKSDKSFVYLIITDEDLPKVLIKREKDFLEKKISEVVKHSFGPFKSKKELEEVLKIVRKIFPFYEKKNSYNNKSNLYEQIGLLPKISISKEEYLENIKNIKSFFEGKKKKIIKDVEKKMLFFAKSLDFEKAGVLKKKMFALKNISDTNFLDEESEKFFTKKNKIEAYDVAHLSGENMVGVMAVVGGSEKKPELYKKFNIKSFVGVDDNRALREVLERRFEHLE